ncbi:MAG: hypothetical protein AAGF20_09760 [Pseudomonadota bacterium]
MGDGLWKLTKKQVRIVGPGVRDAIYRVVNSGPATVNVGMKDATTGKFVYLETRPGCSMDVPIDGGELWIYPLSDGGSATGVYTLVR